MRRTVHPSAKLAAGPDPVKAIRHSHLAVYLHLQLPDPQDPDPKARSARAVNETTRPEDGPARWTLNPEP